MERRETKVRTFTIVRWSSCGVIQRATRSRHFTAMSMSTGSIMLRSET